MRLIFDIEADGLLEDNDPTKVATKIHCLCYYNLDTKENGILTNYDNIKRFLSKDDLTLIGHNIIRYDIPMLEKFIGISLEKVRQIDTLGLSWYLYPSRLKHGLEEWGDDLGVIKPKIVDWNNLTVEEYIHRCEEDVKINTKLFDLQINYLSRIYGEISPTRIINYITFKLKCAREQEEVKWKLNVEKCQTNLTLLLKEAEIRTKKLVIVMPKVIKYRVIERPKKFINKDGEVSAIGKKWLRHLEELSLPEYHVGTIRLPVSIEEPKAAHAQLKKWFFDLGWEPETFKYEKEKDGTVRKIPQLSKDVNGTSEICDSVKKLYEIIPEIRNLEGLFILNHRIGILEGFLERKNDKDFLKAEIRGLTNTLRFQHTTIVNLPQIPKPYWREVRECLITPDDNHVLCGSDMSSLEDKTGRHYMYYYDPEYVNTLEYDKNYDSHLHIAVEAKLITEQESEEHKLYERTRQLNEKDKSIAIKGKSHKAVRLRGKKTNFASKYGAGVPKIALTASVELPIAKSLHTAYWKINWSIKAIARDCIVKTIDNQMWLFNPVSMFWYSLRYDKDRFSTLNQGTGVYCFDTWVRHTRKRGWKNCGQFHDEIVAPISKGLEENFRTDLTSAIQETNEELNLNVKLGISIDFGVSYADIH